MRSRIAKISASLAASILLAAFLLSPAHADDPPFGSNLAPGYNLVVYVGGTVEELEADAASEGAASAFAVIDFEFLGIIVGAPGHVNEAFANQYPDGVPAGTVLIVWVPFQPPPLGSNGQVPPFTAYGTGLVSGDVVGTYIDGQFCATTVADVAGNWVVRIGWTAPCDPEGGDVLSFRLNGLLTNETEIFIFAGGPADVVVGTQLTLVASIWLQASLGHDWVQGDSLHPGEEFTLNVYQSEGGVLLETFARLANTNGMVRWSSGDLGIDLVPDMYLVLSGAEGSVSVTMRSVSLGVWTGGTIDDYATAASGVGASSFYIEGTGGDMIVYVIGAPSFVNQAFIDAFSPSFEATEPEVGVWVGAGAVWAPLYDSGISPVVISGPGAARLWVEWNRDYVVAGEFAAGELVDLTIRDTPGGTILFEGEATTDGSGDARWFSYDLEIPGGLRPGFELVASDGAQTRILVVSDIRIKRMDVEEDVVEGVSPPNAAVTLSVYSDEYRSISTVANPEGDWSVDVGAAGTDFGWDAWFRAEVSDVDGDRTSFYTPMPLIYVNLSSGYASGTNFQRGVPATIELFDAPGGSSMGSATLVTDQQSGHVSVYVRNLGFELAAGMLVRVSDGTTTKELVVVELSVDSVDLGVDTLGGQAPPDSTVQVAVYDSANFRAWPVTANSLGRWVLDLAGEFDLTQLHYVQLVGSKDHEEDYTYLTRSAPLLYDLTVDEGPLSPVFDREATSYTVGVANGVESAAVTAWPSGWAEFTINAEPASRGAPVEVALAIGANPIEIVVTHLDGLTSVTYTVTVTRAAPAPPPPIVLPPPRFAPALVIVNDDGGTAVADDFTVLLDSEPIPVGTTVTVSIATHTVTIENITAFYAAEFSAACGDGSFFAAPGLLVNCTITLDDLPLTEVLGAPLPGGDALIDEALNLVADAFELDGQTVVQASSAGTPPEITVTIPVDALADISGITVTVLPANELAIGEEPPPGTLLIGGTAYVISITDALGEPISSFDVPIELSFAIPAGTDTVPLIAYLFDEASGTWVVAPGMVVGDRYVVTPTHLSTFGLFQFEGDGGFVDSLPARGVALTVAVGGTFLQLDQALSDAKATSVWVSDAGALVGYVLGAPVFVNEDFVTLLGGTVPPGQLMIVVLGD